jgi:diguanylate cyclase (GGDEF)-like protein
MNIVQLNDSALTDSGLEMINVLLVDDDDIDRESFKRMLSKSKTSKFHIDESSDFVGAIELLEKNDYAACLVDYNLTDRTGLELFEAFKKTSLDSSIILLTGLEEDFIANEAMEAGASDFLSKDDLTAKLLERTIRYSIHHKKMGKERDYLAHHDSLTGLVNRALFFNRLNHQLERIQRHAEGSAILYIDIDSFKSINDTYGHEFGDSVLKGFAQRLSESVRSCDTISRLGGDEFVMLLENLDQANAHLVSQKILKSFDRPLLIDSSNLYVTVSIGMKFFKAGNLTANQLLVQADQALYVAKHEGKKTYRNYNVSMQKVNDENLSLEHDFLIALRKGQIVPYYQPKYCVNTGKVNGFEVLARWPHRSRGFIPPNIFVPCAEKLSIIFELTEQILNRSCEDHVLLKKKFAGATISVNVSASICSSPNLISMVDNAVRKNGLDYSELELEVTETAFMANPLKSIEILGAINAAGIKIAVDDFGKGYSSLSYLTELPIDILKIDMDFVKGIGMSMPKESVVKVIIDLSKKLGFAVVAEGVETAEQLVFLKEHSVDLVQGYYFSKPMSLADCLQLEKS